MKWETFKDLYNKLSEKEDIGPHTKIRILYSTQDNKRNIKECNFSGLLPILWRLFDQEIFAAIAIFIIKDKTATPVFKYMINNKSQSIHPPEIGNNIILTWKNKPKRARQILTNMLAHKIFEEMYEFQSTKKHTN